MKIKYSKLSELRTLTGRELDFFFYLIRFQDDMGYVIGVHNKEVCETSGMCKQTFYDALRSLERKGIIKVSKNAEADYDILILNNDLSTEEARKEGYIQMNRPVFQKQKFKKLKGHEKYMLLELLKRTNENNRSYIVGTKKFYEVFTELLGVSKRVIRGYLHSLKSFFSVGIKEGKYYITYLHSVFRGERSQTITQVRNRYFVKMTLRRNKAKGEQKEIQDTADLLSQYRERAKSCGISFRALKMLLTDTIKESFQARRPKDRYLSAKYVHKLLRNRLNRL